MAWLNQLSPHAFEWLVPGLLEEKLTELLRSLPKTLRKAFVPVPDVAHEAMETLKLPTVTFREGGSFLEAHKHSLYEALAVFCQRRLGKPLPTDSWELTSLPSHLLMNFRLLDTHNQFLTMGRDLVKLQQQWGSHASTECRREVATGSGLEREHFFLAEPLPTKQADFEQRLTDGKQRLMTVANEYVSSLEKVLEEYHTLTPQLHKFATRTTTVPEIKQHLKCLVYEGFLRDLPLPQLKHLPRYLKAVKLRLERLDYDPHKDAQKAAQLAPLWEAHWQRR